MDPAAPMQVARNTFVTSAMGAMFGGIYGVFKRGARPGHLALSSAINSGIGGATFFSIREFVVSPILVSFLPWRQYERRRRVIESSASDRKEGTASEGDQLSWADIRSNKLLDTGLSGAISGGVLNSIKRGKTGTVAGIVTGAMFCTVLQLGYNELSIMKLKWAAHERGTPREEITMSPRSFTERILMILGFTKVSDDAYLARLRQTRDKHLKRIQELEEKIQEDRRHDRDEQDSS